VHVTIPSLVQHDLNVESTLGTPAKLGKHLRRTRLFQRDIGPGHYRVLRCYSKDDGRP
jgi:hypothetical protein